MEFVCLQNTSKSYQKTPIVFSNFITVFSPIMTKLSIYHSTYKPIFNLPFREHKGIF